MRILHFISLIVMLIGGMASCKTDIDPSGGTDATLDSNKVDIMTYATSNATTKMFSGTMTTSGLYYILTKPGSSTVTPAFGQELEYNYTLYVLNGPSNTTVTAGVEDQLIDSAYATTPIFYPFFSGSLRAGLQEGFKLMHEGDQAILLVPSSLAFGNVPSPDGKIPANSPLRYDITLKRARTEDQQINEYITANKLTVTQTTSDGLRFIRTKSVDTTISIPASDKILTIRYTEKLLRYATPVDSTRSAITYSKLTMPAGFNEGLAKMRVGEKATLLFPSSLGYGTLGATDKQTGIIIIPPNTPLRYDIELVSAQ